MTEVSTRYGKPRKELLDQAQADYIWHEFRKCTCRPTTEEGPRSDVCTLVMRSIRSRMEVLVDLIRIDDPNFSLDKEVVARFKLLQ